MSLTVFHCCWLSLTVSPSTMELLHVYHSFPAMVASCLSLYLPSHEVPKCLSMSPMVASCLSLYLRSHVVLHVSHSLSLLQAVSDYLF